MVFLNSRHFDCRIGTLISSTQAYASDTMCCSTRRFDPFFCRIVGVLTVVSFFFETRTEVSILYTFDDRRIFSSWAVGTLVVWC